MSIQLRDKSACKYDQISLGEVMLRLDPGEGRIRTARHFTAWKAAANTTLRAACTNVSATKPPWSPRLWTTKSAI
ncbi:MAG: hypothetical protein WDM76_08140 [Limisphaerales bacterium]